MTVLSEPHFVNTTLRYFTPPADGSKAWSNINADPTTGEHVSNWDYTAHAVKVENLRGHVEATLDKNGFQFFHHPAKHTSFANDEEITCEYYPESIELIRVKQLTGASHVVLFDHTICCRRPGVIDMPQAQQPVPGMHVDQTTDWLSRVCNATSRRRMRDC
ncbi:hypothetical protein EDB85DRAFT_1056637 [Lactarius pseudohatsudake]|nr:hypothetical protein EDB85DRAFT_1056637 [Lactarius pseudohatsudake]